MNAADNDIVFEAGSIINENQHFANGSFGNIVAPKCTFNGEFIIGLNKEVNNITMDSCEFNGPVFIFTNGSIANISIKNCTFNGVLNIINNANITGTVEIIDCKINRDVEDNNISRNNFFNSFRFTGNTVKQTMQLVLNKFENEASFKNNNFNNLVFDLNSLRAISVFTGNTYTDAVFNSNFFYALTLFSGEIINNKIGFVETYFNAVVKFADLYKTNDGYSSFNLEGCSFNGRLDITRISNRIRIFNLYSNIYSDFNIDVNLLRRNLDNISIKTMEGSKVVNVVIVENKQEEMDSKSLAQYNDFLSYMPKNYTRLNMNKEAAIAEEIKIEYKFDIIGGAIERFFAEALYFLSFCYFRSYFRALLYAVIVITVFAMLYEIIILRGTWKNKKPAKPITKLKTALGILREAFSLSINVFLNLAHGKSIRQTNTVPSRLLKVFEAILGIYFIASLSIILGNVLL